MDYQEESIRTITEIIDVETGEYIHIDDLYFHQHEGSLFLLRRRLYEYACLKIGTPKYVCAVCRQPVVLLGRKTFRGIISYFAHYKDSDECPIKTHAREVSKAFIDSCRYVGETDRHKELKNFVACYLETSHINGVQFDHVKKEQRIASNLDFRSWAVPDVYAECGNLHLSVEVQISTLFLSTIIERDVYYRFHNIFILWVFRFDENRFSNEGTLTMKDIVWANNGNLFICDDEAQRLTEETGELTLLCRWYQANEKGIVWLSDGVYVTLSDLTFDKKSYLIYYVDVASEIEKIVPGYREELKQVEQMELEALHEFSCWLDGVKPTKEEVLQGIKSGLFVPRWIKKGNHWGYAKYGHTIIPFIYNYAEDFKDGVAVVRRNRKYGMVNFFGEEIIEPRYQALKQFSEGCAPMKSDGVWGFVNEDGVEVISPRFHEVVRGFQDGQAIVRLANGRADVVINSFGDYLVRSGDKTIAVSSKYQDFRDFSNGYAPVCHDGVWGFVNEVGGVLVAPKYQEVGNFSEGFAPVKREGRWGFVNEVGEEVISPRFYKVVRGFQGGGAIVGVERRVHSILDLDLDAFPKMVINTQGNYIVKCGAEEVIVSSKYDQVCEFSDGFAAVMRYGKWGFVNEKGDEVISPRFHEIVRGFQKGRAIVVVEQGTRSHWSLGSSSKMVINTQGDYIVKCGAEEVIVSSKYDQVREFSDGYAAVVCYGKWGFVNEIGEEVISPQYDWVKDFANGFAVVKLNGCRVGARYPDCGRDCYVRGCNDWCPSFGGRWGVIDGTGKQIVPIEYDRIKHYSPESGFAVVVKGGMEISIAPDGNRYESYWDYLKKKRQPIETYVAEVKENGVVCNQFLTRGIFVPIGLLKKPLGPQEHTQVYVVKADKDHRKSIIASTHLLPVHFEAGDCWSGEIVRIEKYGVFVKLKDSEIISLAHVSQMPIRSTNNYHVGDLVKVQVVSKDEIKDRLNIKIL